MLYGISVRERTPGARSRMRGAVAHAAVLTTARKLAIITSNAPRMAACARVRPSGGWRKDGHLWKPGAQGRFTSWRAWNSETAARGVWNERLTSNGRQECQLSAEARTTGAWRLVGLSHVTQFVTRGGSVEGGCVKMTTAPRIRSGRGGRACLPVHSRVACLSGSIRVTLVQPKRLSRVNGQVQVGSACVGVLAACLAV